MPLPDASLASCASVGSTFSGYLLDCLDILVIFYFLRKLALIAASMRSRLSFAWLSAVGRAVPEPNASTKDLKIPSLFCPYLEENR